MRDFIIGLCIGLGMFIIVFSLIDGTTTKQLFCYFAVIQLLVNWYLVFKTKR